MEPTRDPKYQERLRMAFELYDAAEQLKRRQIRRRNPDLSEEEVERKLRRWLQKYPDE